MRLPRFAPVLLAALLLAPAAACDKSKEPTPEEIEAKLKADLEEAAARVRNNKTKDAEKIYLRILETHADQPDAVKPCRSEALYVFSTFENESFEPISVS